MSVNGPGLIVPAKARANEAAEAMVRRVRSAAEKLEEILIVERSWPGPKAV